MHETYFVSQNFTFIGIYIFDGEFVTSCFMVGKAHGWGHSQNGGLDLAIVSSYTPYFENVPILGLYFTHESCNGNFLKRIN